MRLKVIFAFCAFYPLQPLWSQNLNVGALGSFASTWLFNQHVSNSPAAEQTYKPSFGNGLGLMGSLFFSKSVGVETDFFYSTHNQQYTGDDPEYESETSLKRVDVPMMVKFKSSTGAYIELGAIYSTITNASYYISDTAGLSQTQQVIASGTKDISKAVSKQAVEGLFGLGMEAKLFLRLYLMSSIRFTASFTDLKGVDAYGRILTDDNVIQLSYGGKYEPTHSAAVAFLVGLMWRIGKDKEK